jgi:hypothetical protein
MQSQEKSKQRAEISEMWNQENIEEKQINPKVGSLKRSVTITNLQRLLNSVTHEREAVPTTDINKSVKECQTQTCDNEDKMHQFSKSLGQPKPTNDETDEHGREFVI